MQTTEAAPAMLGWLLVSLLTDQGSLLNATARTYRWQTPWSKMRCMALPPRNTKTNSDRDMEWQTHFDDFGSANSLDAVRERRDRGLTIVVTIGWTGIEAAIISSAVSLGEGFCGAVLQLHKRQLRSKLNSLPLRVTALPRPFSVLPAVSSGSFATLAAIRVRGLSGREIVDELERQSRGDSQTANIARDILASFEMSQSAHLKDREHLLQALWGIA
jgi:hypothetical protein